MDDYEPDEPETPGWLAWLCIAAILISFGSWLYAQAAL